MSKKFSIPNFDTKKLIDGVNALAENGKIFLEKHGTKIAIVSAIGATVDNVRVRIEKKKSDKEHTQNAVKAQQVACKLQAELEAEIEEKEAVLNMNEKLREALVDKVEVHKDEEE